MKLAIVSDVHGNLPALKAVIADLKLESPDQVVNLGDCVSARLWPEETAQLLRHTGWLTIRGNHDRLVAGEGPFEAGSADEYCAPLLSKESKDWLINLPVSHRLTDEIFLCHGTPTDDSVYLTEKNSGPKGHLPSETALLDLIKGETAPIICCGHTHIQRVVPIEKTGQTIVNPGSIGRPSYEVGHPLEGRNSGTPHARYSLMTKSAYGWVYTHKLIPYDWETSAAEADKNGDPEWARALRLGFFGTLS
ncbi:MAG: metallophosphoesterase family protein [Rhodobacteraceae bacterium]|nr:metallophosphoesterase family protein [Paracoccaceae bacterium]